MTYASHQFYFYRGYPVEACPILDDLRQNNKNYTDDHAGQEEVASADQPIEERAWHVRIDRRVDRCGSQVANPDDDPKADPIGNRLDL